LREQTVGVHGLGQIDDVVDDHVGVGGIAQRKDVVRETHLAEDRSRERQLRIGRHVVHQLQHRPPFVLVTRGIRQHDDVVSSTAAPSLR
jgi:hypothetical protein